MVKLLGKLFGKKKLHIVSYTSFLIIPQEGVKKFSCETPDTSISLKT